MRIVRAGADDAFVLAALSLQFALSLGGPGEPGYLDRAADHWLRHRHQLPAWFAERDGAHAGYLQAVLLPETAWPGQPPGSRGRLWAQAMYVAPDHRRHGVGRSLLAACEHWAAGEGVGVIRLRCEPGAEQFYDAAGYAPATEVREKRLRPLR
ncbi:GNAT family N-acetyltransferase [Janibacter anophelis]|uniref:GNAT family N-acetyltransferase n=1 Tax=Janibacter anophelis TaxID=319054 RepID=UPI0008296EB4|nr:GNAT family N-acetyltransferase [Janibacter anophelis]